jgi:hypothetical protein
VDFTITKTKLIAAGAAVLILVGGFLLLLPKVQDGISRPIVVTRNTLTRLEYGLIAFRADFGDYPPSDKDHLAALVAHPAFFERDTKDLRFYPAAPVSDAFRPPKPILYFRAEPTEESMFDAADNPLDPTGREGFASQEHFEMLARRADGQRNVPPGWVRRDYLLISAGPDRLFGYMVEDETAGGLFRPAQPDEKQKAWCDDVTNFKY